MKNYICLIGFVCLIFGLSDQSFAQSPRLNKTIDILKNRKNYPNYVLVSAHRGYWANHPENTKEAYQQAIDADADIIEMDVRLTKDDQLVVFHDGCLDRMTTGYGRLRDEDWAYVNTLFLKHEEKVTSSKVLLLSDALDFMKNKAVIAIDIKEGGTLFDITMVRVLKMLKSKGMLYQSVVKGKMPYANLKNLLKEAEVTLNDFFYTPIAFSNTQNLNQYIQDYTALPNIYAIELVYKQSADITLSYMSTLAKTGKWAGNYSFWPESGDGVVAEKIPLTDTDPIIRKYSFKDLNPTDPMDDGRGDWDWLLPKGANYIITDRSELLIDYLTIQGKRIR